MPRQRLSARALSAYFYARRALNAAANPAKSRSFFAKRAEGFGIPVRGERGANVIRLRSVLFLAEIPPGSGEIGLAEELEILAAEDLAGEDVVIDGDGDGGLAISAEHQGVGKVDVQLGAEEIEAETGEGMILFEFNDEQISFAA